MRWLVLGLWLLLLGAEAQAFGEIRFAGETRVEVITETRPRGQARVSLRAGAPGEGAQRVVVYEGRDVQAWSDASGAGVLVGLLGGERGLSAVFVPVREGRLGAPRQVTVRRPEARDRAPVGIAIAARPDGFAFFWQEASVTQPGAQYTTHALAISNEGRPGQVRSSSATWPIADVAWIADEGRYYFLLYYAAGGRPDGTRFCGVHVEAQSLRSLEHPWWATRAGQLDEAQLVVRGTRVVAVYRGGASGDELLEVDVTGGRWGQEAPASRSHGRIAPSEAYGARFVRERLEVHRAALDTNG